MQNLSSSAHHSDHQTRATKKLKLIPQNVSPNPLRFMPDLVIREETLAHEKRTVIIPENVAELTKMGFKVAIVDWKERCFSNSDYKNVVNQHGNPDNFTMILSEDWKKNPLCQQSLILGTKEIEDKNPGEEGFALTHHYVHFDHSYKGQTDAEKRIARFAIPVQDKPIGQLYDHEYFTDEKNNRTHAFSQSAGFATTAMTLQGWAQKMLGNDIALKKYDYNHADDFFIPLAENFKKIISEKNTLPQILILGGAKGRSAQGAINAINELNKHLKQYDITLPYTRWGKEETQARQTPDHGLKDIENFDMIINCTFTNDPCLPFVNEATLEKTPDRIQVIGDVTCDTTSDKNRLRFENYETTDFDNPAYEVMPNKYAITVNHSPSLFPRLATIDIANQFFNHLVNLLHDKKFAPTLEGDHTPSQNAFNKMRRNRALSGQAMTLGYEIAEDQNENSSSVLSDKAKERIHEFVKTHAQNNDEKKIILYGLACGLAKISSPFDADADPKFYTPSQDSKKTTEEVESFYALLQKEF